LFETSNSALGRGLSADKINTAVFRRPQEAGQPQDFNRCLPVETFFSGQHIARCGAASDAHCCLRGHVVPCIEFTGP
jgi:hypothetical protein